MVSRGRRRGARTLGALSRRVQQSGVGLSWTVQRHRGSAQELHHLALAPQRGVHVFETVSGAVVLGSTQSEAVVDTDRATTSGYEVARRRSGGGLVLLDPGGSLWVDVVIPRDDPLWDDDVGRSFLWVGEAWQRALAALGCRGRVLAGPERGRPWCELVCFAGRNTGEVVIGSGKVVGLAQRRSRDAARFQCQVLLDASLDPLVDVVAVPQDQRARLAAELVGTTAAVDAPADQVLDAFMTALR